MSCFTKDCIKKITFKNIPCNINYIIYTIKEGRYLNINRLYNVFEKIEQQLNYTAIFLS